MGPVYRYQAVKEQYIRQSRERDYLPSKMGLISCLEKQ